MSDATHTTTLAQELATLMARLGAADRRARNPATDPRIALEAEEEAASLNLKIADLQAKMEDATIVNFPKRRRRP